MQDLYWLYHRQHPHLGRCISAILATKSVIRTVLLGASIVAALLYFPQVFVVDVWQLLILQGLSWDSCAAGGLVAAPSALC